RQRRAGADSRAVVATLFRAVSLLSGPTSSACAVACVRRLHQGEWRVRFAELILRMRPPRAADRVTPLGRVRPIRLNRHPKSPRFIAMKKLLNDPSRVVREMLEGLAMLAPDTALLRDANVVVRRDLPEPHSRPVAIISGGGSGHEPAHAGYVGEGML